jgi:hypothetical protein
MRYFSWKPRLKFPVIGEARDVLGHLWYVRDIRTTKHGFDLLFGSPEDADRRFWGLPRLIATRELITYWDANRTKHDGILFDLPAGRTTLKRVRARFGFNYLHDLDAFWRQRIDELRTLDPRDLAERYNVKAEVVKDARRRFIGKTAREIGWWQTPETLAILRAGLKLREISQKLGIGHSHAHRLKVRALALEQETPEQATNVEPIAQEIRPAA